MTHFLSEVGLEEVMIHGLVCVDCGGQHTPRYWRVCVNQCLSAGQNLNNILLDCYETQTSGGKLKTQTERQVIQIQDSSLSSHTDTFGVIPQSVCHLSLLKMKLFKIIFQQWIKENTIYLFKKGVNSIADKKHTFLTRFASWKAAFGS